MQRRIFVGAGVLSAVLPPSNLMAKEADIVLGNSSIQSGPLGVPVKTMLAGAGLAFAKLNKQGGIGGRAIRLESLDDGLNPEKAVANYTQLLANHNPVAFFGCVGSGTTAAAANILKESGAPLVGGYAVSDSARDKVGDSGYFVRATTGREAKVVVEHLTTLGVTRIAVAHLDNPGGAEALALINSALAVHSLKALASGAIKGDGSNVSQAAKTIAAANPQVIIMYLAGALGGELMKSMWELGSRPSFYGLSIVPGEVIAKVVGPKAGGLAITQVIPYPWNVVDTNINEYRRLATEAGAAVSYYGMEGYLGALVMIDALKRASSRSPATRQSLHEALRATKLRVSSMDVDFTTRKGTGSTFVELVQLTSEGRFIR
jgi:branched-chain amino acid transport system substrate-binding protein